MQHLEETVDVCVVGGGMAGICAAVASARHGANTLLVQDRPVLGGNASEEIRMWICGCNGPDLIETGILEEICLTNLFSNPAKNWAQWQTVLHGIVNEQPNLKLMLNASVQHATANGGRLGSVSGWQCTTETRFAISARYFIDCSGDAILAPLAGADFTVGREARRQYGEAFGPEQADRVTMGMSCLIQPREYPYPIPFQAPAWAKSYTSAEQLPHRNTKIGEQNFWWLERCDPAEPIHHTEQLRDELLAEALGVWNYIKNHDRTQNAANWDLEWMGFLPGKRESRRYLGDHVLCEPDIRQGGRFEDVVAYGGWTMDDHVPGGILSPEKPTCHYPAPTPFGIPYRSLYSRNVDNLFCAGRCHSATHAAFSSTRVMGTCAVMGQAAGTAAAMATARDCTPRELGSYAIRDLQQALLADDCFLPGVQRNLPDSMRKATLSVEQGNPEPLRSGVDRPRPEEEHAWAGPAGSRIVCTFPEPRKLHAIRLVFDSDLSARELRRMPCFYPLKMTLATPPGCLIKAWTLEARLQGSWRQLHEETANYQRLRTIALDLETDAVAFIPRSTWDRRPHVRIFAMDVC